MFKSDQQAAAQHDRSLAYIGLTGFSFAYSRPETMLVSSAPPSPSGLGLGSRQTTSVVHATCTADCRTLLWGGAGQPMYDEAGMCWCSCDGEGWSDTNILGRPSCVPMAAHLTFGWVGLIFSVAGLVHATFHLRQQV